MKKKLLFVLMVMSVIISSCANDDNDNNNNTPTDDDSNLCDYTIMLYGTGGSNLDDSFLFNMEQIEEFGYSSDVQFVATFKFSSYMHYFGADYEGTRYITLTPDGLENEYADDDSFMLNDPQNIADFIDQAKKDYPAKKYILIFWNHGSTFDIYDQPVKDSYEPTQSIAKSLLNDDTNDTAMSIFEVEEALKRSNGGVDLVYFDACLMFAIENLYQIKDYTKYVLGAAHIAPEIGGNYAQLFASLEKYSDIEEAITDYVDKIEQYWGSQSYSDDESSATSMTFAKMSYMDQLIDAISDYTDLLCELYEEALDSYENAEDYEDEEDLYLIEYNNGSSSNYFDPLYSEYEDSDFLYKTEGGVLYYFYEEDNDCTSYTAELKSAFSNLATGSYDSPLFNGQLSALSTKVNNALDSVIIAENHANMPSYVDRVCTAITWIDCDLFEMEYTYDDFEVELEVYKFSDLYKMTAFDMATGWSRFLEMNQMLDIVFDEGSYMYVEAE
ncbi:MAG: clostripain-related cysteine peptidase [Rikenellaceae bacterium]